MTVHDASNKYPYRQRKLRSQYELNAISCRNAGELKHAQTALNKQALSLVEVFRIPPFKVALHAVDITKDLTDATCA